MAKAQFVEEVREPREPRILLWDIETAPVLGHVWGAYEQNVLWIERDWYLLTIAWRWLGEKTVHVLGLDDFEGYEKDPHNDYALALHAWELFDEADIVVAHNGVSFDTKKAHARMIFHNFDPPSPVVEFDTLQAARAQFKFTTNRLNDVCAQLGIGEKVSTGGIDLWKAIVNDRDPKAWAKMKKYNKHDVVLLEQLYLRLRPWSKKHPNVATIADRPKACPKCGVQGQMVVRGYRQTAVSVYSQYRCGACGGYCRGRQAIKTKTEFVS
jgi:hypothetical protein